VQFIREGDDIAGQQALLISPQMYREFLKPRHKQLFDAQKRLFASPFYVWFHSDGAIYDIIPDFIEIGVDVLNPVQLTARGMDAEKLKRQYGREISFWGGAVDTQNVLPRANPDEVRRDVKERIRCLAAGGGFVFAAVHNIQDDVPAENIIAMLEAFRELRDY
jgi:uroporphyrinogen decarboxylase